MSRSALEEIVKDLKKKFLDQEAKTQALEKKVQDLEMKLDSVSLKFSEKTTEMEDDLTTSLREFSKKLISNKATEPAKTTSEPKSDVFEELKLREVKKRNIIIHGVSEPEGEKSEDRKDADINEAVKISEVLDCGIQKNKITKCHRIGKFNKDKTRPLVVGFEDESDKISMLKNAPKLKDLSEDLKKVSIVPDLTRKQREEEDELKNEAEKLNQSLTNNEAKNFLWKRTPTAVLYSQQ